MHLAAKRLFITRWLAVAAAGALASVALGACSAPPAPDRNVTLAHGLITVTAPASAPTVRAIPSSEHVRHSRALTQLAPAERLVAAGRLPPGGAVLTFHVDPREVKQGARPFLASLDPGTGQWMPVPSRYDPATSAISARVTHFSVWAPFSWVNSQIAAMAKGALLSIFGFGGTGGYPQCDNYDVTVTDSHPGGTSVGACAQTVADGKVEVRLGNIRPYLLDVTYPYAPDGGSSVKTQSPDLFVRLWTAGAGDGHVLLPGFGSADIDFPLSPGDSAQLTTRLDGEAFRAAMLESAVRVAVQLGGKAKQIIDALDKASCALDYLHLGAASTLTEQNAEDFGSTAFECVSSVLPESAGLVATAITLAASVIVDAISASWAIIDNALGDAQHVLTVQVSACPSAAEITRAVAAQNSLWQPGSDTILAKGIICVGPYVQAIFQYPYGGGRVLLQQQPAALKFLAMGTGPICTSVKGDGSGYLYVPPRYGRVLNCILPSMAS